MTTQVEMFDDREWPKGDPRDCWGTPRRLYDPLDMEFEFVLDAAANNDNHKCALYFDEETDALRCQWIAKSVWLNPPFSDIGAWLEKAWRESQRGSTVVVLLPANRTGRAWFHKWVINKASEIRFVEGRVQYVPPPGVEASSCGFDSMIVVYRDRIPRETVIGRSIKWAA